MKLENPVKRLISELREERKKLKSDISIERFMYISSPINGVYEKHLKYICDKLDISYKSTNILNSSIEFNVIEEIIRSSEADGVLYNCPFISDGYVGQLLQFIDPKKDIECITPKIYGEYMCNMIHNIKPCISQVIVQTLLMNGRINEEQKFLIITPEHLYLNSRKLCSTLHNSHCIKFISNTSPDLIPELYNSDVIISFGFNTTRRILRDSSWMQETLGDVVVLDFGYTPGCQSPSIDESFYDSKTIHYNLNEGLMDMYIISAIKNLFNKLK